MSSPDPELLKKLIDDFAEKQAMAVEEVRLVEQQILELEARIQSCTERLGLVAQDRQKVIDIMARYASVAETPILSSAASTSSPAQAAPAAKTTAEPKETKAETAKEKPAASAAQETAKQSESQASTASSKIKSPPPSPAAKPPAPKAEDAKTEETKPQETAKTESEEKKPEGEDDTVKNINDALRGLFR